jgi:hypothetical protein
MYILRPAEFGIVSLDDVPAFVEFWERYYGDPECRLEPFRMLG